MQRPAYTNPPPAHSPPLHHPVPQHVSTVPQLRSPPPPQPPSQPHSGPHSGYGYGGQQQQGGPGGAGYMGGAGAHPAFGNFMNDQTAQMGFQLGKSAVNAGQEYVEQNFGRFVNVSALKHYFNVSNSYVATKLYIVLFPWWHRPWSRQQRLSNNGQDGYYLPPREDMNSPDMYIPMMALVTYILLSTLLAGLRGAFHPELLGYTATLAISVMLLEIMTIKVGTFLLSISSSSQLLDLVAYSGYKFVGVIISLLISELLSHMGVGGSWLEICVAAGSGRSGRRWWSGGIYGCEESEEQADAILVRVQLRRAVWIHALAEPGLKRELSRARIMGLHYT
ncbi:YIF1-domain-containing protein [Pleomassaria siparia CBS 279.74]|uniref:Protein YIF1 n=1 Tax=Pleomassaria siparia CBS 279.74 TaxID=1314801 RepID=A0A6G1KGP5_9PLEO|nr:YIF1-domain-containing protein [Pleomassaria siparia CBS 279.74]